MQETIFNIIQITLSILLITIVLLQQKGSGLGSAFGGSNSVYSTKRGVDKTLHNATITISVLFFATSLIRIIL